MKRKRYDLHILVTLLVLLVIAVIAMTGRASAARPLSDYLAHEFVNFGGLTCLVVYTPRHSQHEVSPYPDVSGVSCDWGGPWLVEVE